jgi:ABC-2 type transport system permease protein
VLLALGGVLVPSDELPDAMAEIAQWLPSGALAEVLHAAVGGSTDARAWWVLIAWALVAPLAATRLFRFDG